VPIKRSRERYCRRFIVQISPMLYLDGMGAACTGMTNGRRLHKKTARRSRAGGFFLA